MGELTTSTSSYQKDVGCFGCGFWIAVFWIAVFVCLGILQAGGIAWVRDLVFR